MTANINQLFRVWSDKDSYFAVMDLGLLGDCQHTARQKYQRTAKV